MAYRVKAKDFILEGDTLEEYKTILGILGIIPEKPGHKISVVPERLSIEAKLEKLFIDAAGASAPGLATLRALETNPTGLTDVELREVLKVERSALGGILGGLSKRARANELTFEDIILKGEKGGKIRYRLTEAMKKVMESKQPVRRAHREVSQEKDAEEKV